MFNGFGYIVDADLNDDGRINGIDHTISSLFSDEAVYDIESFEYDKNGNRTKLVQNGDIYTYQYGDRNRLEAVYLKKKDTTTTKLYLKYTYDANGNTVERVAYTDMGEVKTAFEYDTLNRVVKTTEGGKSTEYLYDNAGNRFIKKGPEGTTLYLRHGQIAVAMDVELPVTVTDVKGKVNRYVLSGELLAGRITKTVKIDGSMSYEFSYYHLDHLNSTKCVSDEAGVVEVRYVYRAFGSQLAKIGSGEAKYTYGGKELDEENGLYYFNARYYDAEIGRFISVDPVKDGLNWYSYCNNNPLRFVDPTGLVSWNEFGESMKEIGIAIIDNSKLRHSSTKSNISIPIWKTPLILNIGLKEVKEFGKTRGNGELVISEKIVGKLTVSDQKSIVNVGIRADVIKAEFNINKIYKLENPFNVTTGKISGAIDLGNSQFKLNIRKPIYDPNQGCWLTDMKKDWSLGFEIKTQIGEISTRTNISNVISDINKDKSQSF